jgi:hypothetical protein
MDQSTHDVIVATLANLGLPAPTNAIHTMLLRGGCFVGHKLRYDSGSAVLLVGGNTIELYDRQGTLLKTVALEAGKEIAA